MRVNLLKERNRAYSINWIEILIIISVAVFIMVIGIHYYFLYLQNSVLRTDIINLDSQINTLIVRVAEYNSLKTEVEELEEIKEKIDTLKYIWDDALIELGFVIPGQTMVNNLQIENMNLSLSGFAADNQKVLDFIDNMKLSPIYNDIKIINISQSGDVNYNIVAVIETEEGEQ